LLLFRQHVRTVVAEAVEVWHLRIFAEGARRLNPFARPLLVGLFRDAAQARTDLPHPARRIQGVGLRLVLLGRRQQLQRRRRLQTQIGTDWTAALDAGDFMAAEAAVFLDEVVTLEQLRRFFLAAVADQVRDLMMALQAARFEEA